MRFTFRDKETSHSYMNPNSQLDTTLYNTFYYWKFLASSAMPTHFNSFLLIPFFSQSHCNLKPIFHCNAKPFALCPGIGLDPQCHNFTLGIPTCWYIKMLKFALPPIRTLKFALHQHQPPTRADGIQVALGPQRKILALAMYISCFLF